MKEALRIADLFREEQRLVGQTIRVQGWVRTRRDSKAGISFIEVNDGSCLKNLQVIVELARPELVETLRSVTTGAGIQVEGVLQASPGKGQSVEMHAASIRLFGGADPATYPLQKKRHSFEFLRQIGHLRPRTNTLGAVARVRSRLSFAVHQFFQERGFFYLHTPIITSSDCEGAGEVFRVTTPPSRDDVAAPEAGDANVPDFFGKPAYLTVSGQLQAEIYALALGRVYTFGPTFRAENSNTSRHLAEFWMVEPEMAFCDLQEDLEVAQALIKNLLQVVLTDCNEDLEFFSRFIEPGLRENLERTLQTPFETVTYTEAVEQLKKAGETFAFPVKWGMDLQAEHERFLTEKIFEKPVALVHFPRHLKPFYMRVNDDEKTVAAMDILVPGIGEIIGGSQREERLDMLLQQMELKGISTEDYRWYVELREFGSVPHAGFGLGLERLIQFATGLPNIREVIPFPRTPGHAYF
ncbi:asparagine--tRNA ligase [Desulforhabdus sp. TSK]|uniref:asparagine--tRNA ligase n=1 Tax=Desulforhabdus sp. TSK TaxID=2925014 RepID=UPI001FC82E37|nr:asparagine--tRNA ligase [Desulforhabdus sp. TSK]GKT07973.1 asparagine--tRNA ligase [Desulforhabdus sp. TSK]